MPNTKPKPKKQTGEYDRYALLDRHPKFLKDLKYRCQFTGAIVGKRHKGRYQRYDMHHTHSGAYGHENPGWNYLLLNDWSHWFVHALGGELILGPGAITKQNRRADKLPQSWLWRFPNPAQRCFHCWCRLPWFLRKAISVLALVGIGLMLLSEKF